MPVAGLSAAGDSQTRRSVRRHRPQSRRNLEIDVRSNGATDHTLLSLMDTTITPMGSRLLQRWLHEPLRNVDSVIRRQHWVTDVLAARAGEDIRASVKLAGDLERILTQVNLGSASPQDIGKLGEQDRSR